MELYIFAAISPVILLLIYIYDKDPHKEPPKLLMTLFILGALSIIPTIMIEKLVNNITRTNLNIYLDTFLKVLIEIALIEEGVKWLITRVLTYRNKEFDESYDAIVYAVFVSLGFACVENIIYVTSSNMSLAFFRAFTSIPGHCCFGVIMGYYFSKAKYYQTMENSNIASYNILLGLLYAVIEHTIYNYVLFLPYSQINIIIWSICYLILLIVSVVLINKSVKANYSYKSTICNYCRQETKEGKYCVHCGNKL